MDEEGNRAVFSTNITFKRSPSVKGVKDSVTVVPGTTGDVPTIVVQLSAESNLTTVTVAETTKGVADDVREVQVFRISAKAGTNDSTEYPYGTYSLQYGHDMNALTMSLEASAEDFANAVAIMADISNPLSECGENDER